MFSLVAHGYIRPEHPFQKTLRIRGHDIQRGMNKAVANNWITIDLRNRYRYQLTPVGYAAGRMIDPATRLV